MSNKVEDPVLKEYGRLAATYDRRWSFYIRATIRETLTRLDPRVNDRLLDVGCGTGALLHVLSVVSPWVQLQGVDPSAEMLRVARKKLGSSADLTQASAEALPFPDSAFDIVVSTSVLHYLHDPHQALVQIERVLRPNGKLLITDWCDDYLACRICGIVLRVVSPAPVRAYTRDECEGLLKRARFEAIQVERYKINWLWGLMTARANTRAG